MADIKILRNGPCLCGSGKKSKHCCYKDRTKLESPKVRHREHFLSGPIPRAEGIPEFSQKYFEANAPDEEVCVYKLLYSCLLRPEVDELASKISNKIIRRGRSEEKRIQSCSSASDLIELMQAGIDPLNHVMFKKKMLNNQEETIPLLLLALQEQTTSGFVELASRILVTSEHDNATELMNSICKGDKPVYQIAVLCILLGFYNTPEIPQFLWNHFCGFRLEFPEERYWRGPFYGLWENWALKTYGRIS